jgi:tRNA modification GTPase
LILSIVGRPNAGKSTLLNALLNEERAIVSAIAGTTRDTIEETMNINGIIFRFIDTAGIRYTMDEIEAIGVSKAKEKIKQSTLVLLVVDISETTPAMLHEDIKEYIHEDDKFFLLLNKMDLNPYTKAEDYYLDNIIYAENTITTSALHQMNIEYLKEAIYKAVVSDGMTQDQSIVSNIRHYDALHKSHAALDDVLRGIDMGVTKDFIAMDIRQCLHYLGEISGTISNEDLLDSIFSRFCIGK